MKKVLLVMLAFAGSFFAANSANAQAPKVGMFDLDMMVQVMPGYRAVDSLLGIYEQDSLRGEYEFAVKEYNRLDSTYKSDSAKGKAASVLNYQKDQRSQIATTIIYWQQISQQKSEQKRQELAGPLYERILGAYEKVLKANNYLVILKPASIELLGSNKVENVFEKVARELNITLPEGMRTQGAPAAQQQGSQAAPATRPAGTTRPAPKKQ